MKDTAKKIDPGDYILAALSPKDRLEAAFRVATIRDVDNAVKTVRRKAYEKKA